MGYGIIEIKDNKIILLEMSVLKLNPKKDEAFVFDHGMRTIVLCVR